MIVHKQEIPVAKDSSDLLLFFLCAFGYTWLSGTVAWMLDLSVQIISFVASPGPLIGAVVVILRTKGSAGIRDFFVRAFRWRFSPVWYVVAALIPFVVILASTGVAVMVNGAQVPDRWFKPDLGAAYLIFVLGFLIWNGIGEEVGWRGFALPRLQHRFGSLGASIILGVIWACWHLPLFFIPGSYQYGDSLALYILLLVSWTVIVVMLMNRAQGSVLVAIIFHESVNFIAFTLRYPGIYNVHFYLLGALLVILLLPKPLFVDVAGNLAASMVHDANGGASSRIHAPKLPLEALK